MPYARKKFKKTLYRKKSYRKRYKDDKINTRIERKIAQIAKKEDVKNRRLNVRMLSLGTNVLARQPSSYGYESLPDNATDDSNYTGQWLANMTAIAGSDYGLTGPVGDNSSPADTGNLKKEFFITKIQCFLQFINPDPTMQCRVKVCLVYVPNANYHTAADNETELKPSRWITGVVDARNKGMFKQSYLNSADFSNIKHVVLKSKQFKLNHTVASSGKGDPIFSGGYNTRELNWSVPFKGKGKKFVYNSSTADGDAEEVMSDGNIFLTINHDQVTATNRLTPIVRGALGVQYYVGSNLSISVRDN